MLLPMDHFSYVQKYYAHLYTVTGGQLKVTSSVVTLFRQDLYQVRVEAVWNGKAYAGAYRMEAIAVEACVIPWGSPNHPLIYQLAVMLRELCKSLASHGCEYAIPEY